MKRTLVSAFAVMLFAGAANAAPVGNPFLRGVNSPAELAKKIEASLTTDGTGRSIIDDARCLLDRSCASAENYLAMFQKSDPEANLTTVAQVPNFLRALRVESAPEGEYWLACLKLNKKGKYEPLLHCVSRRFKTGEKAWVDPKTRRIVLASDCTNPVEKKVLKRCVEEHFFTKVPDTVARFALLGPAAVDVDDECIGVKRAGETDFERWWIDECADEDCNFSAASEVVGQPVRLIGSYVPQPGEHVLRLPAFVAEEGSSYVTVLCLDRDGEHSDVVGVRWFDYRRTELVTKAVVWYDKAEVPVRAPLLYWPWGEWTGEVR